MIWSLAHSCCYCKPVWSTIRWVVLPPLCQVCSPQNHDDCWLFPLANTPAQPMRSPPVFVCTSTAGHWCLLSTFPWFFPQTSGAPNNLQQFLLSTKHQYQPSSTFSQEHSADFPYESLGSAVWQVSHYSSIFIAVALGVGCKVWCCVIPENF